MADSKITVSFDISAAAATKALDDLSNRSDNVDKGFQKLKDSGNSAFSEVAINIGKASGIYDIFAGNLLANVAEKGIEAISEAATKLFEVFGVEGVKAAADYQQALQGLNVALAGAGNYSAETSKDFEDFAQHIQDTTKYSNTAVLTNTALLESLTRLSGDGLKKASQDAMNWLPA